MTDGNDEEEEEEMNSPGKPVTVRKRSFAYNQNGARTAALTAIPRPWQPPTCQDPGTL